MITPFERRKSLQTMVGHIPVGGDAPIAVQSMTNTDTADINSTVEQIKALADAGSEIVRVTVDKAEAAIAVPHIVEALRDADYHTPIVGDFHYNGHELLSKYPDCAKTLAKYRINPGNVGFGNKRDTQFSTMIEIACKHNKPVRIGVNWGSLDKAVMAKLMDENSRSATPKSSNLLMREALVTSALQSAAFAESIGMPSDQILLACKTSQVPDLIAVYQTLAANCNYALHLGLTEAGMGSKGIVATAAALGVLLTQGIGDTIRCSLTPKPSEPRTKEVKVAQHILQSLHLRAFAPEVAACPGCGRTTSTVYQELAIQIESHVKKYMPRWRKKYQGVENLKLAVMGCVVNGPGESKHANIGISLPGTGEAPRAPVFIDGKKHTTLEGASLAEDFIHIIDEYVSNNYKQKTDS